MQQASCLEGDSLLWIWPLYLHVNKKSDDDDDDGDFRVGISVTLCIKVLVEGFLLWPEPFKMTLAVCGQFLLNGDVKEILLLVAQILPCLQKAEV